MSTLITILLILVAVIVVYSIAGFIKTARYFYLIHADWRKNGKRPISISDIMEPPDTSCKHIDDPKVKALQKEEELAYCDAAKEVYASPKMAIVAFERRRIYWHLIGNESSTFANEIALNLPASVALILHFLILAISWRSWEIDL